MKGFLIVAVIALHFLGNVEGLKILVYQTALGMSHVQHIGSVVDTLVEKGHQVVSYFWSLILASESWINTQNTVYLS